VPKYTDEANVVFDTGDVTIKEIQDEIKRLQTHNTTLLGEKRSEADKRRVAEEATASAVAEVVTVKSSVEAEWTTKITAKDAELAAASTLAEKYKTSALSLAIDSPARELATTLTTAPDLALPHIKSRLSAEIGADGSIVTKVLSKDGKASDMTLDALMAELIADPKLTPIMKASQASGGGGGPRGGSGHQASTKPKTETVAEATARRIAERAAAGK